MPIVEDYNSEDLSRFAHPPEETPAEAQAPVGGEEDLSRFARPPEQVPEPKEKPTYGPMGILKKEEPAAAPVPEEMVQLTPEEVNTLIKHEDDWTATGTQGLLSKGVAAVASLTPFDKYIPLEDAKKPSKIIPPSGLVSLKELEQMYAPQDIKSTLLAEVLARKRQVPKEALTAIGETNLRTQESDPWYQKLSKFTGQVLDSIPANIPTTAATSIQQRNQNVPRPSNWNPIQSGQEFELVKAIRNGEKTVSVGGLEVSVDKGDTLEKLKDKAWNKFLIGVQDEYLAATRSGLVENVSLPASMALGALKGAGTALKTALGVKEAAQATKPALMNAAKKAASSMEFVGGVSQAVISPLEVAIENVLSKSSSNGARVLKGALIKNPILMRAAINATENAMIGVASGGGLQGTVTGAVTGGVISLGTSGLGKIKGREKANTMKVNQLVDTIEHFHPEIAGEVKKGNVDHIDVVDMAVKAGVDPKEVHLGLVNREVLSKLQGMGRNDKRAVFTAIQEAGKDENTRIALDTLGLIMEGKTVAQKRVEEAAKATMKQESSGTNAVPEHFRILRDLMTSPEGSNLLNNPQEMATRLNQITPGSGNVFTQFYNGKFSESSMYADAYIKALGNVTMDARTARSAAPHRRHKDVLNGLMDRASGAKEEAARGKADYHKQAILESNERMAKAKTDLEGAFNSLTSVVAYTKKTPVLVGFYRMVQDAMENDRPLSDVTEKMWTDIKANTGIDDVTATGIEKAISDYNNVARAHLDTNSEAVRYQQALQQLDMASNKTVKAPSEASRATEWMVDMFKTGADNDTVARYLDALVYQDMGRVRPEARENLVSLLATAKNFLVGNQVIPQKVFDWAEAHIKDLNADNKSAGGLRRLVEGMKLFNREVRTTDAIYSILESVENGNKGAMLTLMAALQESASLHLEPSRSIVAEMRDSAAIHWFKFTEDLPLSPESKLNLWKFYSGDAVYQLQNGHIGDGILTNQANLRAFVDANREIPMYILARTDDLYARVFKKKLNKELYLSQFISVFNGFQSGKDLEGSLLNQIRLKEGTESTGDWLKENDAQTLIQYGVMATEVRIADKTGVPVAHLMSALAAGTKEATRMVRELIYDGVIIKLGLERDMMSGKLMKRDVVDALHLLDGSEGMTAFLDGMTKEGQYYLDGPGKVFHKLTVEDNKILQKIIELPEEGRALALIKYVRDNFKQDVGEKSYTFADEVNSTWRYMVRTLEQGHDAAWWKYVWNTREKILSVDNARYQLEWEISAKNNAKYGYKLQPPYWREQFVRGRAVNSNMRMPAAIYLKDPDMTSLFGSDRSGQLAKAQAVSIYNSNLEHPVNVVSTRALQGITRVNTEHAVWDLKQSATILRNLGYSAYADFVNTAADNRLELKEANKVDNFYMSVDKFGPMRIGKQVGLTIADTALGGMQITQSLYNIKNVMTNILQAKLTNIAMVGKLTDPRNLFLPGVWELVTMVPEAFTRAAREVFFSDAKASGYSSRLVNNVLEQYRDAGLRSRYANFQNLCNVVVEAGAFRKYTVGEAISRKAHLGVSIASDYLMDHVKEPVEVASSRWILDQGANFYTKIWESKEKGASREQVYEMMKQTMPRRPLAELWELSKRTMESDDAEGLAAHLYLHLFHLESLGRFGALSTPTLIKSVGRWVPSVAMFYSPITTMPLRLGNMARGTYEAATTYLKGSNPNADPVVLGAYAMGAATLVSLSIGVELAQTGWGWLGSDEEEDPEKNARDIAKRGLLGWVGAVDFGRTGPVSQIGAMYRGTSEAMEKGSDPLEAIFSTIGSMATSSRGIAPSVQFWSVVANGKKLLDVVRDADYENQLESLQKKEKELSERAMYSEEDMGKYKAAQQAVDDLQIHHSREGALRWFKYLENNTSLPIPGTSNRFFLQMVSPTILWQMHNDLVTSDQWETYSEDLERYQPLKSTMENMGMGQYLIHGTNFFNAELFYADLVSSGYLSPEIAKEFTKGFNAIMDEVLAMDKSTGFAYDLGAIPNKTLDINKKWNNKFNKPERSEEETRPLLEEGETFYPDLLEADEKIQKSLRPKGAK
jgi:hypothetical protein